MKKLLEKTICFFLLKSEVSQSMKIVVILYTAQM